MTPLGFMQETTLKDFFYLGHRLQSMMHQLTRGQLQPVPSMAVRARAWSQLRIGFLHSGGKDVDDSNTNVVEEYISETDTW